jgi:hypothetical protein
MAIISPIVNILTPALSVISGTLGFIFSGFKGIKDIVESLFSPTKSLKDTLAEMGPITAFIATSLGIAGIAVTAQLVPGLIRAGVAALTALPAMVSTAVAAISSASAATLGIGAVAIIGGIAAAVAAMKLASRSATQAGDIYSPANGKTQVSTKEGGLFNLSPNDSLFAFPESKIKPNTGNRGNQNTQQRSGNSNVDVKVAPSETVINIDGTAIARATTKQVIEQMRQTAVKIQ